MVIGPKPLISRKKGREGYAADTPGVNTIRSGNARLRTPFFRPSPTDPISDSCAPRIFTDGRQLPLVALRARAGRRAPWRTLQHLGSPSAGGREQWSPQAPGAEPLCRGLGEHPLIVASGRDRAPVC